MGLLGEKPASTHGSVRRKACLHSWVCWGKSLPPLMGLLGKILPLFMGLLGESLPKLMGLLEESLPLLF
jgi:hypothetical protein